MSIKNVVHARTLMGRLNELLTLDKLWTEKPDDECEKKVLSSFGRFTVQIAVRCCLAEGKTPNCHIGGNEKCVNVVSLSHKEFHDLVNNLDEIATSKANLVVA